MRARRAVFAGAPFRSRLRPRLPAQRKPKKIEMRGISKFSAKRQLERRKAPALDMKLEVAVLPVSDVERAKRFYGGLGWRLDADIDWGDGSRGVQFTPPGSPCSIHFGTGLTSATPGSDWPLPRRVRHRGSARRACRSRRRGQRAVPPRRPRRPRERPGSGPTQLRLVRLVLRSGRQRLVAAGDHRAVARARGRRHNVRFVNRTRGHAPTCGGRAWRAEKLTGQHDEGWPDWTPSTSSGSRPASSCRPEPGYA